MVQGSRLPVMNSFLSFRLNGRQFFRSGRSWRIPTVNGVWHVCVSECTLLREIEWYRERRSSVSIMIRYHYRDFFYVFPVSYDVSGWIAAGKEYIMNSKKYIRQYFLPPACSYDWARKDHIDKAPIWCSVDLRDGNQSLIEPMGLEEKIILQDACQNRF